MVSEKKINHLSFLSHSLASVIDQAILSGMNLLIGLLLIRFITKSDYGIYTQLIAVGIFVSVVLEAFITNPLTTYSPSLDQATRYQHYTHVFYLQRYCNAGLAILFGMLVTLLFFVTKTADDPWWLGLIFAAYLFFNAQREFRRSIYFLEQQSLAVLKADIIYFVAAGLGILLLYSINSITTSSVFLVLLAGNIVSLILNRQIYDYISSRPDHYKETVILLWKRAKWSLPGAILAWITNYSYLFIAAALLGITASAELNASRLLLMPVALAVLAWSRIAKPVASQFFYQKNWLQLRRLNTLSITGILTLIVVYLAVLLICLPWLHRYVLGPEYQGITSFVVAWGIYFMINAVRFIGSSWLTSHDQYKSLFISSIISLIIMLISTFICIPLFGAWGAVVALCIVELFDLIIIWGFFLPRAKKEHQS